MPPSPVSVTRRELSSSARPPAIPGSRPNKGGSGTRRGGGPARLARVGSRRRGLREGAEVHGGAPPLFDQAPGLIIAGQQPPAVAGDRLLQQASPVARRGGARRGLQPPLELRHIGGDP